MKKKQKWIRIVAIVLAVLLAGGAVFSALITAFSEEAVPNRCEMTIEYMEDEQALHITQSLVIHNDSSDDWDRIVFYATPNVFRRESALFYESDCIEDVFSMGYTPGGLEIQTVAVDGETADWGYQNTNETLLRVACDVKSGAACTVEFDYYLLLCECGAFCGINDTDIRVSAFYFIPGIYNSQYKEFWFNEPTQLTRWQWTGKTDFSVTLTVPDNYNVSATGAQNKDGTWQINSSGEREMAISFGKRWRENERVTESGVKIRTLTNIRGADSTVLDCAEEAIEIYESWFGAFPVDEIEIVQSGVKPNTLVFAGTVWIPESIFEDEDALKKEIRFALAQQYFGISAYVEPVSDAWLSDTVCEYIQYLCVEEAEGADSFREKLNAGVIDSLNITIPGSLYITSSARLFTQTEYDLIIRDRGAVVMHETRLTMGKEAFLLGLKRFYEMGKEKETLGEMDLVAAFDEVTNGDWEEFLTEWLFNVTDYLDAQLDFYE